MKKLAAILLALLLIVQMVPAAAAQELAGVEETSDEIEETSRAFDEGSDTVTPDIDGGGDVSTPDIDDDGGNDVSTPDIDDGGGDDVSTPDIDDDGGDDVSTPDIPDDGDEPVVIPEDALFSGDISATEDDHVVWWIKDNTLTIAGSGKMSDITYSEVGTTEIYLNKGLFTTTIVGEGITNIGAYRLCRLDFTEILLPSTLTEIGDGAFRESQRLTAITIPGSVDHIYTDAFATCSSLRTVTFEGGSNNTILEDSVFCMCSNLEEVIFSDNITALGEHVLAYCSSLEGVALPSRLGTISNNLFKGSNVLREISIPDGVTEIGIYAFSGCTALQSISIPSSVESINSNAFEDCDSLADVYYAGTEDEWNQISIGESNEDLINANIHFSEPVADGVAITEGIFPDEAFREYLLSETDQDGDGNLSWEEIAAVTEMNVSGREITTLEGIGVFTELQVLDCSDNDLTELNLSGNPELYELQCWQNNLGNLDLSEAPNLQTLDCTECGLEEINLNGNNELTTLICAYNGLYELDLRGAPNLVYLDCKGNLLYTLDADCCPNLNELYAGENPAMTELICTDCDLVALDVCGDYSLESLMCFGNRLSSIDNDGLPALAYLYCRNNHLSSLDVSGCPSLLGLSCENNWLVELNVAGCDSLYELTCDNNQLTQLDLTDKLLLEDLYCQNNQLTSLELGDAERLGVLNCYGNGIRKLDISGCPGLVSAFSGERNEIADGTTGLIYYQYSNGTDYRLGIDLFTEVRTDDGTVDVSEENFPDEAFRAYVQEYCDMNGDGNLDEEEISAVMSMDVSGRNIETLEGILYFTGLNELNCSGNSLISLNLNGLRSLSTLNAGGNPSMVSLCCSGCSLWSLDIQGNTALQILECYGNYLQELYLSDYPSLQLLNCGGNQLTALNVYGCSMLQNVNCSDNQLTELNLGSACGLNMLNCTNNQIRSLTIRSTELWNLICYDNEIFELDISGCPRMLAAYYGQVSELYDDATGCTRYIYLNDEGNQITCDPHIRFITEKTGVGITAANFPDDTFRAYVSENFDTDINGLLDDAEIAAVTEIDVDWRGITSLRGLEFFISLTTLRCENNQLTELDISQNTQLEDLYCPENQLTVLDVSGLGNLKTLLCYDNQLTALDVTHNTLLEVLGCGNNQLTELDVTNNTWLENLQCQNNQLTALDVSQNASLSLLICSNNQLTGLDVTNNIALDSLYCERNQLTALVISNNTLLRCVSCYANHLSELDISACEGLRQAVNRGTRRETSDCLRYYLLVDRLAYAVYIDHDTVLAGAEPIGPDIPINQYYFPDEAFRSYVQASFDTDGNGSLSEEELNAVTNINVQYYGFQSLYGVENFTNLKYLNCAGNAITRLDLEGNPDLEELYCSYNQLTQLDVSGNAALKYLECCGNQIADLDIENNTALERLDVSNNALTSIDVSGKAALSYFLCNGNRLTELDVSTNTALGCLNCGVNLLTELDLSNNTELYELGCYTNLLTSLDLTRNTKLQVLNCADNQLTSLDVSRNHGLMTLYCDSNQLTALDISSSTALDTLNCSTNGLTELDLENNTALSYLICYSNQLTSLDVRSSTGLRYLACFDNQITALQMESNYLDYLACYGNSISELDISGCPGLRQAVIKGERMTYPEEGYVEYSNGSHTLQIDADTALAGADPVTTGVPVNAETFPDDAFRACVEQTVDLDGDGYLSDEERAGVKTLNATGWGIVSLAGVEHFTAMETLRCQNNQLTELDVSDLSSLKYLYCSYNEQLTTLITGENTSLVRLECDSCQLTHMDLSGNTSLEYLSCYNNQLTVLDLSGNTNLREVNCGYNPFTTLDLSHNSKLQYLYCFDGHLTELIVSSNPALESLSCSGNSLTGLDLSGVPALKYLVCSDNMLTELDLNFCPDLTVLYCSNNQLESMDLSGCPELNELRCGNNRLTEVNLSGNTALDTIDCQINRLTSLDVSGITALRSLNCSKNELTSLTIAGETLAFLHCYDNALTELDIGRCPGMLSAINGNYYEFTDDETGTVARQYFSDGPHVLTVDFGTTIVTGEDGVSISSFNFPDEAFRSYIQANFDTDGNGILSQEEIDAVTRIDVSSSGIQTIYGLEHFSNLEYLDCGFNTISRLNLRGNPKLVTLYCYACPLVEADLSNNPALKEVYFTDSQLTELDISHNPALEILQCSNSFLSELDLSNNPALQSLAISGNELTELDVSGNPALWELICFENQFTELDVSGNHALTQLYCGGNQLTELNVRNNTELVSLSCEANQLTSLDVTQNTKLGYFVCESNQLTSLDVSRNTSLEVLYCENNPLTALDVSRNTRLERLNCSSNQLMSLDLENNRALTELVCSSNQLTALDVSNNTRLRYLFCSNNQITALLMDNDNLNYLVCYGNRISELDISGCPGLRQAVIKGERTEYPEEGYVEYSNGSHTLQIDADTALAGAEPATTGVPINGETFPDSAFLAYVQENIDRDGDGKLSEREVAGVRTLNVQGQGIVSLAGVEYFTDTETLRCNENQLTALDVSSLSSLKYLYCSYNPMTQLITGNNASLIRLECDWCQLATLDLSGNTNLEILYCGSNPLTGLDLSSNIHLIELGCGNSPLTELDLSHNSTLQHLYVYGAQLTELDISNNKTLLSLTCAANKLTSLDVSEATSLAELYCNNNMLTELITGNQSALTFLDCPYNQLTSLNFSGNPNLRHIDCSNNKLTELKVSGPNLEQLYCFTNELSVLDISGCEALLVAVTEGEMSLYDNVREFWGPTDSYLLRVDQTTEIRTEGPCAEGHAWREVSYVWAEDNSTVTASHTCERCGTEETETAFTTSEVTKTAGCEVNGETTWTVSFNNPDFATQTKLEANIPATGHNWGEPTFRWEEDCSTAYAVVTCTIDDSHTLEIEATVTSSSAGGIITYTAAAEVNGMIYYATRTVKEKYTVTFIDSLDNSVLATRTVEHGDAVEAPVVTNDDWTFYAWSTEPGVYAPFDSSDAVTGNMTVYALWTKTVLVKTWYLDEEKAAEASVTVNGDAVAGESGTYFTLFNYDEGTVTLSAAKNNGKEKFKGWAVMPEASSVPSAGTAIFSTANETTYDLGHASGKTAFVWAVYELARFNVDLINARNLEDYDYVSVPYGGLIDVVINARGYTFEGWYDDYQCKQPQTPVTSDTTRWGNYIPIEYAITYDLDGGVVESNPETYTVEDDFTLNNPTKAGYTFAGWTGTGLTGPTMTVTIPWESIGDRSYTATWTINTYTVTILDADNGEVWEDVTVTYGGLVEITLTKRGYTFEGWYNDSSCTQPQTPVTGDCYRYVKFTPIEYAITYDLDGGVAVFNPESYTIEDAFTLNNPTKTGYTFTGWTGTDLTEATMTVTIPEGSMGDRSYTATWTINTYFVLLVDARIGEELEDVRVPYGGIVEKELSKPGYTFIGWFDDEKCTQPQTPVTGNCNRYTELTPIEYTITYHLDGGVSQVNPRSYNVEDRFTLQSPIKAGYTFSGWTGTGLTGPTMTVSIPEGTMGDLEFTATWTINSYTVTWNINGEQTTETYEYGEIPTHADPVIPADDEYVYTFAGWSPEITAVTDDAAYTAIIDGTPRSYGEPSWTWTPGEEGGYTAEAAFTTNDGAAAFTVRLSAAVSDETTPATCETAGKTTYTATVEFRERTYTGTQEVTIPATGHDYERTSWNWAEDHSTATVTFTCKNDSTHVETVNAAVTSATVEATCTTAGKTTYTATASFEGKTYTDEQEVAIPATGHEYELTGWTWEEDLSTATANFTCKNDSTHKQTVSTTVTSATVPAACETAGKTTYTATATFEGKSYTDEREVAIPATGHDYELTGWSWAEDHSTASVTFTCKNDSAHKETVSATITAATVAASCETAGKTTYTATATFEGKTYTDEQEAAIPVTGHAWGEPVYTWSEDNSKVTAERVCANDNAHRETETVSATGSITKQATCEEKGETTYTSAAFENNAFSAQTKTVANIDALGHDYELTGWTWSEDHSTAIVIFTCKNDSTHKEAVSAAVTATTVPATCETAGKTTYTAKATFEGKAYTDEQEVTIPATGHDYELTGWIWSEDFTAATVTYICTHDETHVYTDEAVITFVRVEPKPEEEGSITYTATAEDPDGGTVTDIKIEILPAAGYTYRDPEYTWAEEKDEAGNVTGYKVTALKACNEDENRNITETVSATSRVTTEAGCETTGVKLWTAAFTNTAFETKTQDETIPAKGHAWGEAAYTWSEDNSQVTAERVCANDNAHKETETVSATGSVTKQATCEEKGETTYTSAAFENNAFSVQSKTIANIDELGHKYELTGWTWSEDYSTATANFTCKNDKTHKQTANAAVTSATTAATCTTAGKTTYTATAAFEGRTYTDEQEVAIPALKHNYELTGWTWSEDYSTATANFTCKNDDTHKQSASAAVTSETTAATCTTAGKTVYTAAAAFEGKTYTDEKETAIPAIGHDYDFVNAEVEWTEDFRYVSATIVCKHDPNHVWKGTEPASFEIITEPTCEEPGSIRHTGILHVDGYEFKQILLQEIPALSHEYAAAWTWTDTAAASVTVTCSRCGSTETKQAEITFERQTTESGEELVYTATAQAEGQTYTDKKTVALTEPVSVTAGGKTTFTAPAGKDAYRWQYSKDGGQTWVDCVSTGHDHAEFSFNATAAMNGRLYRCVVTENGTESITEATDLFVLAITKQPAAQTVKEGETAAFTVTATSEDVTYQWQVNKTGTWNNCTSAGNKTATFSFTARMSYNGWQYRCVVTNSTGSVTSNVAKLTVTPGAPVITKQPADQNVTVGRQAVFSVTATGSDLTYQWQVNKTGTWGNCTSSGNKTDTFSFNASAGLNGWQYRCVVTNAGGSVISDAATLTVEVSAPVITVQPSAQDVLNGDKATFTVTATGSALTYQWQVNKTGTWNNCTSAGNNTATFSFTATSSLNGWQYRCVVSNAGGSVTSESARLTVSPKEPVITKQPSDQNVAEGQTAVFTVTATGNDLSYQWQVNKTGTWNNCTSAGNNTSTFSFNAKTNYNGWQYRCLVVNSYGSVVSDAVTLKVTANPPSITTQPTDQNVTEGSRATFTVAAAGSGLTYQWQVNKTGTWNDCVSAGNDTDTFSFTAKTNYSGWQYRCVVTNESGSVTSGEAKLTVSAGAPVITSQPSDQIVAEGQRAAFTVTATGSDLTYQWQVNKTGTWNDSVSAGNDTATFSFNAKANYSGWQYRCVVTNTSGSVISSVARLTVSAGAPVITKQPSDQNVAVGSKASFEVTATGDNLKYQWQVNKTGTWNDCVSAGNDTATFSFNAKANYSGWQYRCIVTNENGSTMTQEVLLTVE